MTFEPDDCEICGCCYGHTPDCGQKARGQAARLRRENEHLRREVDGLAILVEQYSGGVYRRV